MIAAAQFGANAAVRADLVDLGPDLVDVARDRVLLHSEVRYPPGMNDVVAGDQEADLLADRQHQRVVDIDEIVATIDLLQLFEISRAEGAIKAAPMGTDLACGVGDRKSVVEGRSVSVRVDVGG